MRPAGMSEPALVRLAMFWVATETSWLAASRRMISVAVSRAIMPLRSRPSLVEKTTAWKPSLILAPG